MKSTTQTTGTSNVNFGSLLPQAPAPQATANPGFKLNSGNMMFANAGIPGLGNAIPQPNSNATQLGAAPMFGGQQTNQVASTFSVPQSQTPVVSPSVVPSSPVALSPQSQLDTIKQKALAIQQQLGSMPPAQAKAVTANADLSGVNTTSNASDTSNPTSYQDILNAIHDNLNQYQQTAQQNQDELNAQNNYLQSVQNAQNFQANLTQGEMNQYGVGRPVSLDTGRAAQLGFNNQITTQNLTNQQNIAQKQLDYQQTARQVRTQAAQFPIQSEISLSGQALTAQQLQQQLQLAQLPYSNLTADQKQALALQYYQATGQFPDPSLLGSQVSPTTHSTISSVQGDNVFGYDLSFYATDPAHTDKVLQNLQGLPQGLTNPNAVQSYIQQAVPNSPITGQMIYNASSTYGVPIPLLTALMKEESSLGTKGAATSTMNPGNVGNTDSGATVKYASWQDGVNATAKWLSNHFTGNQPQASPLIQPALGSLSDGTQYINMDKLTSDPEKLQAQMYSSKTGIPLLSGDEVSKVHNIDITTQNLDQMSQLIPDILGSGLGGRLKGLIGNQLSAALQTDPKLSSFQDYRTAALNSIQALAGGTGSGFRLNEGEIKVATDNLPTITDNMETAKSKLSIMQSFINKWKNELLPNQSSPTSPQNQSQSQPSQVNYQGKVYNVDPQGNMTPA